jgi:hypothetical protein
MEPRFRHCEEQSDAAIQPSSNEPKNLTRRANHRHIFTIARILKPAPGNWPRAFSIEPRFRHCEEQGGEVIQPPSNDPKEFDTSGKSPAYLHHRKNFRARAGKLVAGFFNRAALFAMARSKPTKQSDRRRTNRKNLTRRANHRHIFIIARIAEPAPGNRPRAFSIGRRPHSRRTIFSVSQDASASELPSEPLQRGIIRWQMRRVCPGQNRSTLFRIVRYWLARANAPAAAWALLHVARGLAATIRHAGRAWRDRVRA